MRKLHPKNNVNVQRAAMLAALVQINAQSAASAETIESHVSFDAGTGASEVAKWVGRGDGGSAAVYYFRPVVMRRHSRVPDETRARITSMERPANVQSENARPISADACNASISFLERLMSRVPDRQLPNSISPSVQGAIAMHWIRGNSQMLVQIASGRGPVYFQFETPGGNYEFGDRPQQDVIDKLAAMLV